jgi:hypothetical protein
MDEPKINLNLSNEIISGTEVSTNVKQQIIVVPKDKARLVLKEYEAQQKGKVDWISPIALVVTILATLFTADFKDEFFGLEKGFWQAFFTIGLIISAIWCVRNIIIAATQKCKSADVVVEELCEEKLIASTSQEIESLPRLSKWIVKRLLKKKDIK